MTGIRLIVGLGNPGQAYEGTRHNAGAFFISELTRRAGATLSTESKFFGQMARITLADKDLRLLVPSTFMNESGKSVAAAANFFRIPPDEILIAHDELDIPAGQARFKQGGGHGGHNGLRDIIPALGGKQDFHRLRIGIGHPGHASKVSGYVLAKPSAGDRQAIDQIIDEAADALPLLLNEDAVKAMTRLHSVDTTQPG
jgi:PTH1 family peptidyl-tRNA hydrolase